MFSVASTALAAAKECKSEIVIEEGKAKLSRTLGAYPSSLWAWRKKVKNDFGAEWQSWRRAEQRKIECEQRKLSQGKKRWVCIRTARPCRGSGPVEVSGPVDGSGPVDAGPDCSKITRTLHRRDHGDDVKILQELLIERGDDNIEVDGAFGRATQSAVSAFQQEEGISVDGVVGTVTLERLCG